MMRLVRADLHVHTVLSPCAEVEMIPPWIARRALELGIGLLGITDHNASGNAAAVAEAAAAAGIRVLPGMELQTQEEVHLLCLFDDLEACLRWERKVWSRLPEAPNNEEVLGAQLLVDAEGDWLATEGRLLAASANMTLNEAIAGVHALGGLAIPAHVDRPAFSLLANLGFVPRDLPADALEVTRRFSPSRDLPQRHDLQGWPLIVGSDAHQLDEMRALTLLVIAEPTLSEVRLALARLGGREITVEWAAP